MRKCFLLFITEKSFLSGDEDLYTTIIEPLGHRARERNEEFQTEYGKVSNRFAKEFIDEFCDSEGAIDWEKLVSFNSGSPCHSPKR